MTLDCTTTDGVPSYLWADGDALQQVLYNLAIDTMARVAEKDTLSVDVSAEEQDIEDRACLHFVMSARTSSAQLIPETANSIPSTASQNGTTTKHQASYSGLHQAISLKLIELMHGEVWVEESENQLFQFHFCVTFDRTHRNSSKKDKECADTRERKFSLPLR